MEVCGIYHVNCLVEGDRLREKWFVFPDTGQLRLTTHSRVARFAVSPFGTAALWIDTRDWRSRCYGSFLMQTVVANGRPS